MAWNPHPVNANWSNCFCPFYHNEGDVLQFPLKLVSICDLLSFILTFSETKHKLIPTPSLKSAFATHLPLSHQSVSMFQSLGEGRKAGSAMLPYTVRHTLFVSSTVELKVHLPLLLLHLQFMPQSTLRRLDHLSIEIKSPVRNPCSWSQCTQDSWTDIAPSSDSLFFLVFLLCFLQNWLSATQALKQFTQYPASMILHIFFCLCPFLKL